jgi:hypothetical protein
MSLDKDMKWAREEAEPAMREILKRGLGEAVDPNREVIAGGYEQAIEYARVERDKYVGEVGKRDGNYVYHFWPRTAELLPTFGDKLGDAMLKVFKYPDRVSSKHDEIVRCHEGEAGSDGTQPLCRYWGTPDEFVNGACPNCGSTNTAISMSSWAVRVTGYADNPLADDLAASVFNELDSLL